MKTLKDKEIPKNFIGLYVKQFEDYTFFKYEDVKDAVLEFRKQLRDIGSDTDTEETEACFDEIFGDFGEYN